MTAYYGFFRSIKCAHVSRIFLQKKNRPRALTSVHDGDTFYIDREFYGSDTIRLADINASELGQPLSYEACDFLSGLVYHNMVYLNIDNVYIFDYRGTGHRLVCVVYVSCNSTHYRNVNKALLDAGLAEKKDYDNEFNPDTWTLYSARENSNKKHL